jgi:hypothetical protein
MLTENDYLYDIAFSFAGEQRDYVFEVYRILTEEYGIKVFYDQNEEIQAKLWGKDLTEEFHKIYSEQSRYCLIFISKEYKEKVWTRVEKRSALERAIQEKEEYILPAYFDDTVIPGIPRTTGYINIYDVKPEDLSRLILLKPGIQLKQKDTPSTDSKLQTMLGYKKQVPPSISNFESKGEREKRINKERALIKKSIEEDMTRELRKVTRGL